MPMIRITTSDYLAQMLHAQAVRENRTDSKMGELILRQGLEERRTAAHQVEQVATLTKILRGEVEAPQ
jgi:hypothetical protein